MTFDAMSSCFPLMTQCRVFLFLTDDTEMYKSRWQRKIALAIQSFWCVSDVTFKFWWVVSWQFILLLFLLLKGYLNPYLFWETINTVDTSLDFSQSLGSRSIRQVFRSFTAVGLELGWISTIHKFHTVELQNLLCVHRYILFFCMITGTLLSCLLNDILYCLECSIVCSFCLDVHWYSLVLLTYFVVLCAQ